VKFHAGFGVQGSGFRKGAKWGAELREAGGVLWQLVARGQSPWRCPLRSAVSPRLCRGQPPAKPGANGYATACAVCVAVLLLGCVRETGSKPDNRPVIVATIFPLQSIVAQLTGDWANVELLMPPGSSPHDFEPQPAQMEPLSKADLMIAVGLNLDGWADRAAQQVARKDLRVIRMAGSTPAEVTRSLARNPHLWMDPSFTREFVGKLGTTLIGQYPAHRGDIEARTQTLQQELQTMDATFRQQLAAVPVKEFVAYHNAYDPLAMRYGLRAVAHLTQIELAPGGDVAPQDLVAALDAIRLYHLRVIYAEPQFPARATDALREEAGVQVLTLDDLGGPSVPGYDSYQAMLQSDVKVLVEGQSIQP
jgi:zinc transport system substrate-binding protein